jgi:undecaprenyl-diphosphatase
LLLVSSAAFTALALDVTHHGAVSRLDLRIARWNAAHMPGWVETVARVFSAAGGGVGMAVIAALAAAVLVWRRRVLDAVLLIAAYAAAELATFGLKHAFHRPRPVEGSAIPLPHSFSFPSGHAAGAFATLVLASVLLAGAPPTRHLVTDRHKVAVAIEVAVALVLAALVAASRVVLNVHYVSDVLAGACLGLAIAALALLAGGGARR